MKTLDNRFCVRFMQLEIGLFGSQKPGNKLVSNRLWSLLVENFRRTSNFHNMVRFFLIDPPDEGKQTANP